MQDPHLANQQLWVGIWGPEWEAAEGIPPEKVVEEAKAGGEALKFLTPDGGSQV